MKEAFKIGFAFNALYSIKGYATLLDTSSMDYEIFSDRKTKVSLCKNIINNRLKYLISISFLLLLAFTLQFLVLLPVVLCTVA